MRRKMKILNLDLGCRHFMDSRVTLILMQVLNVVEYLRIHIYTVRPAR